LITDRTADVVARFAVRSDQSGEYVLVADRVAGLFVGRYGIDDYGALLDLPTVRLDCRLTGVRQLVPFEEDLGDVEVHVLDLDSKSMGSYSLADVTLEKGGDVWNMVAFDPLPPHVGAEGVWERWRTSPPREKGEWTRIPVGLREGWVEVSQSRDSTLGRGFVPMGLGEDIYLDGGDVVDTASFFCAIGEAFCGPGGHFGGSFTGFFEYLGEYSGGRAIRLHWKDMAVAERALAALPDGEDGPVEHLERILKVLDETDVQVLRA
jgi:hypothetical protein